LREIVLLVSMLGFLARAASASPQSPSRSAATLPLPVSLAQRQISMSEIKGLRTLRCWLAKAQPADEASAAPNLHRMTLSVCQHSLGFKHRHRIIGRIHVDLFGETIAA